MQLHKHHDKWIGYAMKFTNYDFAQDIVQEMYLKLFKKKDVNCSYVFLTIKCLYLDKVKREKKYTDIKKITSEVEIIDFELKQELEKTLKEMPFALKECLLENQNYSLRKLQDRYNINYGTIRNMIIRAKKILKENPVIAEHYGKDN